eukprot:gnl/TRDRNA2_/TRDRNA2_175927_c0_seq1.p1 gnl/TRDRNA2_/TRDRNA2_175927_c0~~gnl/TRDRNA2_/TRDRNA2_175927_c0_seq1.p1  ORF type:complete len:184 (-),score=25.42 gnl/TRDRNA2_/TRDRNA2_175927_c0_seq1:530-1081(-)
MAALGVMKVSKTEQPETLRADNATADSQKAPISPGVTLEEDEFDHIGFGYLEAIGAASASLGLISTLVFSLCIGNLANVDPDLQPNKSSFLAASSSLSTYTMCYSLLEYYYIQMFLGVERYIKGRVADDTADAVKERAELVKKVRAVFATFNRMRGAARNCMWLGLVSLVLSSMAHVQPFEKN